MVGFLVAKRVDLVIIVACIFCFRVLLLIKCSNLLLDRCHPNFWKPSIWNKSQWPNLTNGGPSISVIRYESYRLTYMVIVLPVSPCDLETQCHLSRLSYHGAPGTLLSGILYIELTKGTLSKMQWKARVLPNKKLFFSHACFSQQVSFRSLKLQDVF